ncbi:MAG: NAD(P)-binding domain-containing protein [Thermoproteota archaeon]|jgi:predicted dinucleotide-binding enzyme|nr:NAD(P)-binding domain-containing protein [Thermoproteota archaeon]MDQ3883564.1 NAD(P)-binding domain-containing protein [Thermoproteota archaeon]MDQ5842137.1 NAD(P)-binding domain-containing protein [Thermoproteota archaeon]
MAKVGILGSGDVGKTLAKGFLKHGYQVAIGSDHPEKLSEFKSENPQLETATFEQAAQSGDIVVLSVKGTVAEKIIEKVKKYLSGKTVIDTTNPIADAPPQNGVLKFFTNLDESLMERLQKIAPDAQLVKAFNSVGSVLMINPDFRDSTKPTMFICGNNDDAKKKVYEILEKFGFETEDMGKAESARAIEPLCMLWCIPGFLRNEWTHAFKLLKK